MVKKGVAALMMALMMVGTTAAGAWAGPVAETNITERVLCLFRVYVTEGGEQGLECLV